MLQIHVVAKPRPGIRTRDARLLFHLGAIEAVLRLPSADAHLRDARRLDAGVSLWREAAISALLGGAR